MRFLLPWRELASTAEMQPCPLTSNLHPVHLQGPFTLQGGEAGLNGNLSLGWQKHSENSAELPLLTMVVF